MTRMMNAIDASSRRLLFLILSIIGVGVAGCGGTGEGGKTKPSDFFVEKPQIELLEAVDAGDTAKMARLVNAGANVNAVGELGMTPALWAMGRSDKAGLQFLLEHGANPNMPFERVGYCVTSMAAANSDIWYLDEVLAHGGNPNAVNPLNGSTPIYAAIFNSRMDRLMMAQITRLINSGADLNWQDNNGDTPMMIAASILRYDCVYEMLEKGANPGIKDQYGNTMPYYINRFYIDKSCEQYQWMLKVIELLKKKGINIEHGK